MTTIALYLFIYNNIQKIIMVLWPLEKMEDSIIRLIESVKCSEKRILTFFLVCATLQILILYLLDGKTLIDSIYATAATLTTVGFGDVSPSSPLARLMYIPTMGIGVLLLPVVAVSIYEMHQKKVRGLTNSTQKDHIVILGSSNEIITSMVNEIRGSYDISLVSEIYEQNPFPTKVHFIKGSPIEKNFLIKANIASAKYVVIETGKDSTNILATVLARELNPLAEIIATITSEERYGTLKSLGANHVINTDTFTGRMLASAVFEPSVVELISDVTTSLIGHDLVEMDVPEKLVGKKVGEILLDLKEKDDMTLVAIYRNRENIVNPSMDVLLEAGDRLVVLV